jgi:hypothetical protein
MGRAIVPRKRFVYPIVFDFKPSGEYKYRCTNNIDYNFTVAYHSDTTQMLIQLEVIKGKCTLGVFLAPDGNNSDIIQYMQQKAEEH